MNRRPTQTRTDVSSGHRFRYAEHTDINRSFKPQNTQSVRIVLKVQGGTLDDKNKQAYF
jgi:hypothetical protein